ncbi:hypothetical protein JB92DRAFT_3277834 [Gautieria morchelliformis]|nr:hypothetical protein JB92DRAFT_3277834 [Gautieria morchelliformis]
MPTLLNAYMQYKYRDNTVEVPENPTYFHIRVLGINACALPQDQHHEYINQTLLLHGLLGTSPMAPELAIPIPTLELYRRCRLRSPQFSIQQWVKVLCDLSNVSNSACLFSILTQVRSIIICPSGSNLLMGLTYLEILRRLDHLIKVELGHDQPGWRILHACPACQYKLEGEAELNPSVMGALNGNNSLKRFARGDRGSDTLTFDSDYFLSHEYVDQFANEVKRKVKKVDKETVDVEGDPTDGQVGQATCTDRCMYNAFAETGVFVSVCRHGFVWTILDMMQSGELAKYPLAMVSKLLSVLPQQIGLGYDIACSFTSTLMSSSLASKACTAGLKMVVPAFHGHAHNRLCQLGFHILMSPGFGLEDLETCERIFSSSNAVARLTRHATPFHRRQFIDMFLRQWDAEKYENLGKFLLNNYRQALQVLEEMPVRIKALMSGRQVSEACFATWLQDERDYLESKKTEPDTDVLANVSAIRKLWEASVKLEANATRANDKARLRQVTHDAWEGMLFLQKGLQDVESQLDVGERWTTDSPAYQQTVEYLNIRNYQLAVDKLEGLVVQRLFELTKANVSQTGYKMRIQISKALKARSKAIQRALSSYNKVALALDPPRPKLTWAQIVEYTTIAEFELLWSGAREDICNLAWADARNREAIVYHLKILRAKEEIVRLNVEIRRIATWIVDENCQMDEAFQKCADKDLILANAISMSAQQQKRINARLRATLEHIFALEGYTGISDIG